MFTGLVQGQGELVFLRLSGGQARVGLNPFFLWEKPQIGESIAVNGVCLTAETWENNARLFSAYISQESLSATNLGALRPGAKVNLERALALGDRLGGHMVSGHVDCVAQVASVTRKGESHCFRLTFDPIWGGQLIPKGSVALDGISLTVNHCGTNYLEVNVIPETWSTTTVRDWKPGSQVNMETDMIGKYVRHLLGPYADAKSGATEEEAGAGLSLDFLRQHGF